IGRCLPPESGKVCTLFCTANREVDPRRQKSRVVLEREWVEFFAARIEGWSDDKPAPNEHDDWSAARSHFEDRDFGRDADFRPAREKYTPAEWRKQGRRLPWGLANKSAKNPLIRDPQN
ncbi:MAG: hypothetical protein WCI94_20320, partial [Rhodospirillales bacterium]